MTLLRLCDVHNIPMATNIATAEVLIHGLERGDLDWRDIVHPQNQSMQKRSAASYRCGASFLCGKRLDQTVPFTLKSCAISCTSAAVNSPKGSSRRARVSCGSAASAALSSSAASTAGQTACTPSLPSSTRA